MNQQLFIIGNGFDRSHGVKSGYDSFRDYLRRKRPYLDLELWFECGDLWGDFEGNLASLSRETPMEGVDLMLETMMTTMDEEDDDFSYADYFSAIEMGTQTVSQLIYQLPQDFRSWIKRLPTPGKPKPECEAILQKDALYLSFNYTEFLETLYGVPERQICYLHGCRKNRRQKLVLGHGQDPEQNYAGWRRRNEDQARFQPEVTDKSGKTHSNSSLTYLTHFLEDDAKGNWQHPLRYYASEQASQIIEDYYYETQKNTGEIIAEHIGFFEQCSHITRIVVLGHSLSPVDHPYFRKLIAVNSQPDQIDWRISWYNDEDRDRIARFTDEMGLSHDRVELFQL